MLDKFWETLGEELAKRWLDYLFGPAFLFWADGLGLYVWQQGWETVMTTWQGWAIYQQVTTLLIALLGVFLSSLAMKTLQFPVIRLLEGYWPWPLNHVGSYIVSRNQKDFDKKYKDLRKLKTKEENKSITSDEQDQLSRLEAWAHSTPPSKKELLPTRLGNLLRARELASSRKYSLDSLVCSAAPAGSLTRNPDGKTNRLSCLPKPAGGTLAMGILVPRLDSFESLGSVYFPRVDIPGLSNSSANSGGSTATS